eukprot:15476688-Alexandrium_andersonii.AAC.1
MQRPNIQRQELAGRARTQRETALRQARTPRRSAAPEELGLALEVLCFAQRLHGQGLNYGDVDVLGAVAWDDAISH